MQTHLTFIADRSDDHAQRPTLCFLPGGPGLSAQTLRPLEILRRSFPLVFVDPPGTGGGPEPENPEFEGVVRSIESELLQIEAPVLLCGHSFGALYATELARRGKLKTAGLIAIAAPFSQSAYRVACGLYEKLMTPTLRSAAAAWERHSSRENLAALFSSYEALYFPPASVAAGSQMLRRDQVSAASFKAVLPALSDPGSAYRFEKTAKALAVPKLFIAGALDVLFPVETLRREAEEIGASFEMIYGAGHFVYFDQPEAVAGRIERDFSNGVKGGKP